ncbi:aminoacyl-tRNA hydrolase [Nonomuraea jiangxiensis]|uniref:peptidyl-tRNA hydrolase n=1 Tax=Nonomuraea jiangxiensis TaxID=633440 RepID=A0A1G9S0E4_9ACTN|nr:aminoacyl-tRNA hydrolase [Nonomuraea jiangxiensis]SDM28961.1 Peptidyl-tRNA hydrolase [Nonomuraea jiangxiensis]
MNSELYVLPLVVRIERAGPTVSPPERTDALEAAAMAVLSLLDDPGEWAAEVHAWQSTGKIRKVVRRARGAEWRRALALPGRTVEHRTAEVRVHPPVPLDDWPRDLARLQVSGTELTDTAPPPPAERPILWANPDLAMSAGKAMAQAGHAAQLAWWASDAAERAAWRERGLAVSVRAAPGRGDFDSLVAAGLPVVRDAGFTEIEPGSCTFVAEAPWLLGRVSRS